MRLLAVLPFDSYNDTSAIPPEDELLLLRVHTSNYSADQVRKAEKILTEYYDGNLPFEVNKWIATIKPKVGFYGLCGSFARLIACLNSSLPNYQVYYLFTG